MKKQEFTKLQIDLINLIYNNHYHDVEEVEKEITTENYYTIEGEFYATPNYEEKSGDGYYTPITTQLIDVDTDVTINAVYNGDTDTYYTLTDEQYKEVSVLISELLETLI